MSAALEIGAAFPDTVQELLALAGDQPLDLTIEVRDRRRALGRGSTLLRSRPAVGATTSHVIFIPITKKGKASTFWAYLADHLVGRDGSWDDGINPRVIPGDGIRLNPLRITWTA